MMRTSAVAAVVLAGAWLPASTTFEGTASTPGVFAIPQMGFVSFRCDEHFRAAPFFDTSGTATNEDVTIHAGNVTRRELTTPTHDSVVGLPFAHYKEVTFTAGAIDEARALTARLTAQFVDRAGSCYVRRWTVELKVSPF
jgi:hypothetical protein